MAFDRGLARLLLEVCRYTYADHVGNAANAAGRADSLKEIQTRAADAGAPIPVRDHKGVATSAALILPRAGVNVVCFMGTESEFTDPSKQKDSLADWFKNVQARPVAFELPGARLDCRVHEGFLSELREVWGEILAQLDTHGGRGRPLHVTGHSQGGAEAALATAAFTLAGYRVEAAYTFAAPKPGDARLRDHVASHAAVHRIEFGNDVVPHLPPSPARLGRAEAASLGPLAAAAAAHIPDHDFVGVGSLCYGDGRSPFRIDLSAREEDELFTSRLRALNTAKTDLIEHHHLRGTTAETARGEVGNYTKILEM